MRFRSLLKVWLCSARFTCTGALLTLALVAVWWQPTVTAQSQTLVGTLEVVWGDPHPTLSEGIMEAAAAALGEAIHIQNR